MFPPSKKRKGGGGRCNFSLRSKQIKHSNDHIKGNQVRKGGGGAPWYPPFGGNTASVGRPVCSIQPVFSILRGLLGLSLPAQLTNTEQASQKLCYGKLEGYIHHILLRPIINKPLMGFQFTGEHDVPISLS